jgi:hypothetical protein
MSGAYEISGGQHVIHDVDMGRGSGNSYVFDYNAIRKSTKYSLSISISDSSLDSPFHGSSAAYHGRHASVPSSPTQPIHPRHRRHSEPLEASTVSYSVPSPNKSLAQTIGESKTPASNDHSSTKFKDHPKPILFKTELCRSWEEKGTCRYGYVLQSHSSNSSSGTNVNSPIPRLNYVPSHATQNIKPNSAKPSLRSLHPYIPLSYCIS